MCQTEEAKIIYEVTDNIFCVSWFMLILPAALDPGIYSSSNINEYQKQNNISGK
jgi:hypothetical protein